MPSGRLRVAPIVEGHGERDAMRVLLKRIGKDLLDAEFIDVLTPIRKPQSGLVRNSNGVLEKAVDAAARLLAGYRRDGVPALILVLVDADDQCAPSIAMEVNRIARVARADFATTCVVAVKEFETWFVAAAESLQEHLTLADGEPPIDPENQRCGKRWIATRINAPKYNPVADQLRFTKHMDLALCRQRSPSFDKLCRELEKAIGDS